MVRGTGIAMLDSGAEEVFRTSVKDDRGMVDGFEMYPEEGLGECAGHALREIVNVELNVHFTDREGGMKFRAKRRLSEN